MQQQVNSSFDRLRSLLRGVRARAPARDVEIVVSAENNPYLEWQSMLFHYSCVHRLGRAPTIVVHGDGPLRDGYRLIREVGGRVQQAPSFRTVHGVDYPPRNTPGTLACVETGADYIVLCDPDMIFLRQERFESPPLGPDELSADRSTYLRINRENREPLAIASTRAQVMLQTLERHPVDASVPIVVPARLRDRLSREWIDCIDLMLDTPLAERYVREVFWLTSMWAFVFAVSRLHLSVVTTDFACANHAGAPPLLDTPRQQRALLHYCYGDDGFEKRHFHGSSDVCEQVWQLACTGGHGAGARLREELCGAREFYGSARRHRAYA